MQNSRRIDDLGLSEEALKGISSEDIAELAIQYLIEIGKLIWYHRSWPNGENDSLGFDFLLKSEPSFLLTLQVKSSERGLREHFRKYGKDSPGVWIKEGEDYVTAANNILRALSLSVDGILNQINLQDDQFHQAGSAYSAEESADGIVEQV